MKITRLAIPAVQSAFFTILVLCDKTYHAEWYQYLIEYLCWFGIFGLIYEATVPKTEERRGYED